MSAAARACAPVGEKSSKTFADRLRRDILVGRYVPGDLLPTERDLASDARMGRGSVREALRILETQGLVSTHAGRHGGSVVTQPSDDLLTQQIDWFARTRDLPLAALVDARAAIEPMVAELAARHRADDELATLRRICDGLDAAAREDARRFLEQNAKWHDAMAAACHNELLRAFARSISHLMYAASHLPVFATPEVYHLVSRSHRRIVDAIERRDAAAARRRSERHIAAYGRYLAAAR